MKELATFEEKVKEKLMDSMAGLMPDDQIDALVKDQHSHFLKNHLPDLIETELIGVYKKMLYGIINSHQSYTHINGLVKASEPVKEILTEAAPEIFAKMFGNMMQSAIADFQRNLGIY